MQSSRLLKKFFALMILVVFVMSVFSLGVMAEGEAADAAVEAVEEVVDTAAEDESTGAFYATFWALVPPIVAIGLALITKEVYSSLFIGILVGGLLATSFNPLGTVDAIVSDGLIAAVEGSAGIFIFLVILGVLVALINNTGASAAFGKWAQKHIKTRVGAQLATFALGVLIFIDDYFNCLTVGSVMMPVTDTHKVSRAKLSYLIDATAAPVCMIAPISSWAAAVASYVESDQYTGLELFIKAIPFNYYSLMTLLFVVLLIVMKVDFGPMARHERNAIENGDLYTTGVSTNKSNEELEVNDKGRVMDLVIPIIVLIVICVFALVYVGGILDGSDFITAFADTDATVGLPWGGLVALIVTIIYLLIRRVITFKEAMECIPKGFNAMVPAILILTFATALKNMTNLLGADVFIDGVMKNAAAGLTNFLPAVIFLVGCLLAFATGTSWGTFGILIPIVTVIFPADSPLLFIGISACLAGAVCGDHCSPISDTTIMSSAGARCDHINHVNTQIPYAVAVAAISFVGYVVGGLASNGWVGLIVAALCTVGFLCFIKYIYNKKKA
ncbi:MAG: Na+/H+ antiporter NhaC family protein [Clostridia bacterium]|nr:Na+/H+ antiporter NhaC family protein [Clostridia bacterium]